MQLASNQTNEPAAARRVPTHLVPSDRSVFSNPGYLKWNLIALGVYFILWLPWMVRSAPYGYPASHRLSEKQYTKFSELAVRGRALLENRQYAVARAELEDACRIYPYDSAVQGNLGYACRSLGDDEAAFKHYQQSLDLEPNNAVTVFNLANWYLGQGNAEESKLWIQRCINTPGAEAELVARAKSLLELMNITKWDLGSGDKNSSDYFDSLAKANGICRWPSQNIPLKVYFEDGTSTPHYRRTFASLLKNAFNEWSAATGGKLSWVKVSRIETADIICLWKTKPKKFLLGGVTVPFFHKDSRGMLIFKHAGIVIFTMRPKAVGFGWEPIDDAEARAVCLHEVGHALGLRGHSPNRKDVMVAELRDSGLATSLSERDKRSIQRLYQNYPDTASPCN